MVKINYPISHNFPLSLSLISLTTKGSAIWKRQNGSQAWSNSNQRSQCLKNRARLRSHFTKPKRSLKFPTWARACPRPLWHIREKRKKKWRTDQKGQRISGEYTYKSLLCWWQNREVAGEEVDQGLTLTETPWIRSKNLVAAIAPLSGGCCGRFSHIGPIFKTLVGSMTGCYRSVVGGGRRRPNGGWNVVVAKRKDKA